MVKERRLGPGYRRRTGTKSSSASTRIVWRLSFGNSRADTRGNNPRTKAPPVHCAERAGTDLLRAISDYRGKLPNVYDRPVEGVIAVVDMNRRKVVSVTDTGIGIVTKANVQPYLSPNRFTGTSKSKKALPTPSSIA